MENSRITQLKQFLRDSPDDAFLLYALAIEYVGQNDDATAKQYFNTLLEKHPAYSATYYHLGKLLERSGDKVAAEELYKKGIELTTKSKELHAQAELRGALNDLMYGDDD